MKTKIVSILILTLVVTSIYAGANEINNQDRNNSDEIIDDLIPINPDNPKPSGFDGWAVAKEFANPWPYAVASMSHPDCCIADFNLNTGAGKLLACPMPFTNSWAELSVHCQENGAFGIWNGYNTNGKIVIKSPSYADIESIYGGGYSSISIYVREYTPSEQYVQSFSDTVLLQYNWKGSLDGGYLDFQLRQGYKYKFSINALSYQPGASASGIDPIKINKVWLLYEVEEPTIDLLEPESGYLYFGTIFKLPISFSSALLFAQPGIRCEAKTTGSIDHVKFECKGKSISDDTPSGNTWTATLKGVSSSFGTLYGYACDSNGNVLDSDSVKIFKLGGS